MHVHVESVVRAPLLHCLVHIDHILFQMSFTGLYVGSVLVVLDMILTILALVLNLAVVIGLRYL